MLNCNFHTHTNLCDGKNTLEEMTVAAIRSGLKAIGFSGHSYTAYDESYCMSLKDTSEYKAEISRLQKKYSGKIQIFCGIEQDFGSEESVSDYDYVIGSVHAIFAHKSPSKGLDNFYGYDRNRYYYIDWSVENIKNAVRDDFGGDPYSFCEEYYRAVSHLPETTKCDIIGHFDLITKFSEKESWFDENDPRYIAAAEHAIDALLKENVIFEVNTGAMSRGWRTSPYPSPWMLKKICLQGGSVILNSDSHSADTLTFGFNQALDLIRDCGFKSVKTLSANGFIDTEL